MHPRSHVISQLCIGSQNNIVAPFRVRLLRGELYQQNPSQTFGSNLLAQGMPEALSNFVRLATSLHPWTREGLT